MVMLVDRIKLVSEWYKEDFSSIIEGDGERVGQILEDHPPLTANELIKLCDKTGIRFEWLAYGHGSPYKTAQNTNTVDKNTLTEAIADVTNTLMTKGTSLEEINAEELALLITSLYDIMLGDEKTSEDTATGTYGNQ